MNDNALPRGIHFITIVSAFGSLMAALGMFCCLGIFLAPFTMLLSFVSFFLNRSAENRAVAALSFFLPLLAFVASLFLNAALVSEPRVRAEGDKVQFAQPEPKPSKPTAPKPRVKRGAWKSYRSLDQMTDAVSIGVVLKSDDNHGFSGKPELRIRCAKNKTELLIDLKDGIAYNGNLQQTVQLRFDDTKATRHVTHPAMGLSQTHFLRGAIPIVRRILKHETMKVQYTAGLGGKTEVTTWTLTGAEEAIAPIRKACSW